MPNNTPPPPSFHAYEAADGEIDDLTSPQRPVKYRPLIGIDTAPLENMLGQIAPDDHNICPWSISNCYRPDYMKHNDA